MYEKMKINHINLTVNDAQAARHFLEKYFGLKSMEGTADDAIFVGMSDEDGFVLTLMQRKTAVSYPDTFHIGFLKEGKERTQEIYRQLVDDGYDVKPPGFYHGDDLYINTPFGVTVQVS